MSGGGEDPGIILSFLHITGDADPTFPECVVTEIADAHGIDYNPAYLKREEYYYSLIEKINNTAVEMIKKVHDVYSQPSYAAIARFVNKGTTWSSRTLLPAFNFIQTFKERTDFSDLRDDINFGLATPEHPISINACLAFVICKNKRITGTDSRTTRSMLYFAAKLAMMPSERFRTEFVTHALSIFTPADLISSVIKGKTEKSVEKPKK